MIFLRGVYESLSCVQLFATPWTVARQAPLCMGFPRQEYWIGLPFPSPVDLPGSGIKPAPPALADRCFTAEPAGKEALLVFYTLPFPLFIIQSNSSVLTKISIGFQTKAVELQPIHKLTYLWNIYLFHPVHPLCRNPKKKNTQQSDLLHTCTHVCAKSLQSCQILCDPIDCSPLGSSVHGISQARILEWVGISFSRGSSPPRDRTRLSCIVGRCFTV